MKAHHPCRKIRTENIKRWRMSCHFWWGVADAEAAGEVSDAQRQKLQRWCKSPSGVNHHTPRAVHCAGHLPRPHKSEAVAGKHRGYAAKGFPQQQPILSRNLVCEVRSRNPSGPSTLRE